MSKAMLCFRALCSGLAFWPLGLAVVIVATGGCAHEEKAESEKISMIPLVLKFKYQGGNLDFWTDTIEVSEKESSENIERSLFCQEYSKEEGIGSLRLYDIRKSKGERFYVFEVNPDRETDSIVVFVFDAERMKFVCYFYLHMA